MPRPRLSPTLAALAWAALALPGATAAQAQNFSATSVSRDATGRTMNSRIYVGSGKVLVDPQVTGSYYQGYLLLDSAQRTALLVNPAQGYFTRESPQVAWQTLQSFTPGASPCPPGAPPPGASCRDAGPQMLNGRDTERWEIRQTIQGQPALTRIWVDRKLGIPLRWENSTSGRVNFSSELQNVQEGPQAPSLFVLPQGLRDATQTSQRQGAPAAPPPTPSSAQPPAAQPGAAPPTTQPSAPR